MKRLLIILICILSVVLVLTSCSSTMKVSRLEDEQGVDLSGYWNDTDIQIVTASLVDNCLSSSWADTFYKNSRRNPVIIVGTVKNDSSEHIDTEIISKKVEIALINSGKADMVADMYNREEIRKEREEQQYYASQQTMAKLAMETGADYFLQGAVKTNIDQANGKTVRTYYVSLELIDITTNRKVWVNEDTVKKYIAKNKYKF